jgi:hypothetical protein
MGVSTQANAYATTAMGLSTQANGQYSGEYIFVVDLIFPTTSSFCVGVSVPTPKAPATRRLPAHQLFPTTLRLPKEVRAKPASTTAFPGPNQIAEPIL